MNNENQILNWLVAGISQSTNSMNQNFYFDKNKNEFFSILFIDFLMLDESFNLDKDVTTSYSENTEIELVDKMKRIINEDKNIILIPRLTDKKWEAALIRYLGSIDNLMEKERIEKRYLNKEGVSVNNNFEISNDQKIVESWDQFKKKLLFSKANSFIKINNINLDAARILEIEIK